MRRIAVLLFGVATYSIFFVTFLYAYGFLGNIFVPKSIDSPATTPFGQALLINLALLTLFAVQHSVMARPTFKRWWTRVIPKTIERNVYVLFSSLALLLLFWQWQPLGGVVWDIQSTAGRAVMYGLFASGGLLVLLTTFLINHFDLFGLRQAWLYFRGKEYTHLRFVTPGPYSLIRHPLYLGWLLTFWSTPTMTITHLVFALGTTAYILFAIRLEERNLVDYHGRAYAEYRKHTPMLIPRLGRSRTPRPDFAAMDAVGRYNVEPLGSQDR